MHLQSFPLVPLQVLEALLRPVYEPYVPLQTSVHKLQLQPRSAEGTSTYLPNINKVLSHAWRQAEVISEGAAKADDALVPTYIWNTRITSVYPMFDSSVLNTFRQLLLGYRFKSIYKEFCSYMFNKHNNGSLKTKNNRGEDLDLGRELDLKRLENLLTEATDLKS